MVGIRVNGDLDPVGIVLFRDDRRGELVLLPVPVEISEAFFVGDGIVGGSLSDVRGHAPPRWRLPMRRARYDRASMRSDGGALFH